MEAEKNQTAGPRRGGGLANHIQVLDGLRGAAALIVLFDHFGKDSNLLGGAVTQLARADWNLGYFGVMVFFAISGFLMMHVTRDTAPRAGQVLLFWSRRFARVVPLFVAVLLFAYLYQKGMRVLHVDPHHLPFNGLRRFRNVLLNLVFRRADGVFWTIRVELLFYLLFPLFWRARQQGGFWLAGAILAATGVQAAVAFSDPHWFPGSRILQCGHFFLIGIAAHALLQSGWAGRFRPGMADAGFAVSMLLPALALANPAGNAWTSPLLTASVFLMVACAAASPLARALFANPAMVAMGALSYSVYLIHRFPARGFAAFAGPDELSKWLVLAGLVVPVTLAAAWVAHRHFEMPAREWVNRRVAAWMGTPARQSRPSAAAPRL